MTLTYIPESHASSAHPGASAHPGVPVQPSRSASGASDAPPPRSANVPFLYEIPGLPDYFTIYDKFDSDGKKYKIVCVKKFELMQHLTNIGDSITIDGIVYTKNTGSTIQKIIIFIN